MLALRFYASGSFMEVIGDTMGFDKSTVSRAINNVTNALVLHKDRFIKWPNPAETAESKQNFFLRGGLPRVIGCETDYYTKSYFRKVFNIIWK